MIRARHRTEPHTGLCTVCGRVTYWPAVQPHLPPEVRSLCAVCYPGAFLALHPDVLEALVRRPEAGDAWEYVAPLLFDDVRDGRPEPQDVAELVGWARCQLERKSREAVSLGRTFGPEFRLHLPAALVVLVDALDGAAAG
jgi:hypothetical protein